MSNIDRRSEVIPATGQITISAGANYFKLLSASAALEVRIERGGSSSRFVGMLALIIKRVDPWDKIIIIGTAATSFEYFVGDEFVTEDFTDVPVSTFTATGTTSTSERPSDTVSNLASVTIADGAAAVVVPTSLTRRRMRIGADTNNAGSCYARTAAAGNNIREIVAGVEYQFDTFDEIYIRNDTGADATFYRFEET